MNVIIVTACPSGMATSFLAARRLEQAFAGLAARYQGSRPLSVFYQIWHEPLQTVNGDHLISQVIGLCGGYNVFADVPTLAPRINLESVLARNPEVIVAGGMGAAAPAWLDDWRRYPALDAVTDNGLVAINPDYMQRPTARILQGAQDLCVQLDSLRQ